MPFTMNNAGLLALFLTSLVSAAPVNVKRDVVTQTNVVDVTETVAVVATVWVDGPGSTPYSTAGEVAPETTTSHVHHHTKPTSTSTPSAVAASSSVYVAPSSAAAPSSAPSSTYVAPASVAAPSSVYVAPSSVAPSSVYVAPVSSAAPVSSTAQVSPAAPATTASPAAPATATPAPRTCDGDNCIGDVTWYDTGLGACGVTSGSDDPIVAVSTKVFDPKTPDGNPNKNPLCGSKITITHNGNSFAATIIDRCVGCEEGDLDLSQGFFNTVTNNGDGRVHNIQWTMSS